MIIDNKGFVEEYKNVLDKVSIIFKADNVSVINIRDYYEDNCSEQETEEVSDKVLIELLDYKREKERERNEKRRHHAGSIDVPHSMEEYSAVDLDDSNEKIYLREWIKNELSNCSKAVVRRMILRYVENYSIKDIAEIEAVHYTSVRWTLNKAKEILSNKYNSRNDIAF